MTDKWLEYLQREAENPGSTTLSTLDTNAAENAVGDFIRRQFGLFDLLWFFLAIGSAFKLASSGISFSGD